MKRVVQYSMDILIRSAEENKIELEELIVEALEEKGRVILEFQGPWRQACWVNV